MAKTLRETIKGITKKHLDNGGMIMGQCLSAVGWVDNTVPPHENLVELPITDVAGADFAVGAAITGRRPILVIRFQDFLILNGNAILVFAAKRKEVFGKACPLFIRALCKEGEGTGNSHSGKLHSMFMHFPGIRIWAPVTPQDYFDCWDDFMTHDDPMVCFEHRATFDVNFTTHDVMDYNNKISIFAISAARLNALKSVEGLPCDIFHIAQLKPWKMEETYIRSLKNTGKGLVVDTGFQTCSAGRDIAYQLMLASDKRVESMGLKEMSVSCAPGKENLTPSSEEIRRKISQLLM